MNDMKRNVRQNLAMEIFKISELCAVLSKDFSSTVCLDEN